MASPGDDDSTTPLELPRWSSVQPQPPVTATPTLGQRTQSLEPPSSRRLLLVHTPTQNILANTSRGPGSSAHRSGLGLSASGRRRTTNAPTPHAKAAFQTIDQRRAALTPGRRRQSMGGRRESSHDQLRALSRLMAPKSKRTRTSSSPSSGPSSAGPARLGTVAENTPRRDDMEDDEDDDEFLMRRPEITLPLDEDDDDPVPPRSSFLEGDLTMEMPRRAYPNNASRLSDTTRLSGVFGRTVLGDLGEEDEGAQQGFEVPPMDDVYDGDLGDGPRDETYERVDDDVQTTPAPRESDFGFAVPTDADLDPSTFVMAMAQSSPERGPVEGNEGEAEFGGSPGVSPGLSPASFGGSPDFGPGVSPDVDDGPPPLDWPEMDHRSDEDEDLAEELLGDGGAAEDADGSATRTGVLDAKTTGKRSSKPGWKTSKHGHPCPPFPPATVKRVAEQFARTSGIPNPRIGKDTLAAFQQASDWFFEQVSDDLAAYAKHAGRKTINESDMELLMRRQRQVNSTTTVFSLATQYLPQELVRELRMPVPLVSKKRKQRATAGDDDDDGE